MQKRTLFSLTMLLCSGIAPVFAADLPKEVKAINQFREFRLDQGQIYELYVKTGDGVTTVTFPSAISKIAGVNVSVDGSSDFLISAKPGSSLEPRTATPSPGRMMTAVSSTPPVSSMVLFQPLLLQPKKILLSTRTPSLAGIQR